MIFVKFPEPGNVKTRLAKVLGDEEAAIIYRKLVARVAERVISQKEGVEPWTIWIVFDPAERDSEVREWLQPLFGEKVDAFLPQVAGDLGERLGAAFAAGSDAGFEKVAAVGTDCVDLGEREIAECWRRLEEVDVVFGPAEDGGYYLIGMKQRRPELFAEIPWSSEKTLEASKQAATKSGLQVGELEVLSDIDEFEQWQALCAADASWEP